MGGARESRCVVIIFFFFFFFFVVFFFLILLLWFSFFLDFNDNILQLESTADQRNVQEEKGL